MTNEINNAEANLFETVLWEEPADIEGRDLFHGPGGAEGAPDPNSVFTFVGSEEEPSSEKVVNDDRGRSWTVSSGAKAKAETAASRIVWSVGYHVDQNYFLKRVDIGGSGGGTFEDRRFKRRDDGYTRIGNWSWSSNPFLDTRELKGLRTMMGVITNWDLPEKSNVIARPNDDTTRIFYVSHLGYTLGKSGKTSVTSSKGKPNEYANQAFIDEVENGVVKFHFKGDYTSVLKGVRVEAAKWVGELLGKLSAQQLSDAFRAGGFNDEEVTTYLTAIRKRIDDLRNL